MIHHAHAVILLDIIVGVRLVVVGDIVCTISVHPIARFVPAVIIVQVIKINILVHLVQFVQLEPSEIISLWYQLLYHREYLH